MPDFQSFVDLFLIFGDQHLRFGVAQQVLNLGGRVGRVEPNRHGLNPLGGEI